jgi:hypothetical protein
MRQSNDTLGYRRKLVLLCLATPGVFVACDQPDGVSQETRSIAAESNCGAGGYLQADFVGGIDTTIDWSVDEINCDSMPRPNGEGVRLRFSGRVANEWLAIIIAMPGLVREQVGKELPSNITVTVEGSGRFFSTPNLDSCWTDIGEQERLSDNAERYTLTGTLYCVAPLGELNGKATVTISELSFSSIVDWSAK